MRGLALVLMFSSNLVSTASAQPVAVDSEAPRRTDAELEAFLADPDTTAEQAYRAGVRYFEARRYETAERAWLHAHSLGRNPKLLVAVADARQRRADVDGAVGALEQYLAERPDAPDRASIEARIATLLQSPARLVVRSQDPEGAILLDGVPKSKKTPATLEVDPGIHTVVVVSEGRRLGEQTVRVGYGESRELVFDARAQNDIAVDRSDGAELQARSASEQQNTTIRRAVIATGSVAAAALVSGTVLHVLAARESPDEQGNRSDRNERMALFGNLSFGVAVLGAVTSFTLFMTRRNERKRERETARFRIETRGAGAIATLRF